MNLPEAVAAAVEPLMQQLPIASAMETLVVREGATPELVECVRSITEHEAITKPLAAGLWLYIDELDRSHDLSQQMKTATGSFWHGIMHRREGDFSNSHYWFRNTGGHPAMDTIKGYEPHAFIDDVAESHSESPANLIEMQRAEWEALFEWCANNSEQP